MDVCETKLKGVMIITPDVFEDSRGFFKESFNKKRYNEIGIKENFVQDNQSYSYKDVLRGLHYQKQRPQGKLVSCNFGEVFDVAADINPNSPTFGNYVGVILSASNHKQLWIPPGYAHGFCVLSEQANFIYKCTELYNSNDDYGVVWNDDILNIDWPISSPLLSQKDTMLPRLNKIL